MPEEDNSVELLKKLATDDDLRTQLESDPVRVLKDHGIDVAEEDLPKEIRLPGKEQIKKKLDVHSDSLKVADNTVFGPVFNILT